MKEYPDLDKYAISTKEKHRRDGKKIYSNDRIAELLKEINERIEWLKEMDSLGEGKKHRQVIDAQVTERLNEISRLEMRMAKEKRDGLQEGRKWMEIKYLFNRERAKSEQQPKRTINFVCVLMQSEKFSFLFFGLMIIYYLAQV